MKTYRIWLKDGQTFEIEADGFNLNGDFVEFYNEDKEEEVAVFNINNIGGWVSLGALKVDKITGLMKESYEDLFND